MPNNDATTVTGGGSGGPIREREFGPGDVIATRYRLVDRLGAGAMGEVWRARHEELNTDVAVKLALAEEDDESAIERFRFEAQVSAQLGQKTRHIVAVHDAGRHRGVPFLAMEYVAGRSLEEILEQQTAVAPRRLAAIVDDIASALEVAHEKGIWHRDLKPANIMVLDEPDDVRAKLADFGVAKALATDLTVERPGTTMDGALVGTPGYMSPEQIEGRQADAASDCWSLAVVAYEALCGQMAFRSRTVSELLVMICARPHQPPSAIDPSLGLYDAFFDRALAKDPAARFGSASELAAAFRAAVATPQRRRSRSRRAVAAALGGLVALTVAIFAYRALGPEPVAVPPEEPTAASPDPATTADRHDDEEGTVADRGPSDVEAPAIPTGDPEPAERPGEPLSPKPLVAPEPAPHPTAAPPPSPKQPPKPRPEFDESDVL